MTPRAWLVLLAGLTACGGDDSASTTTATATTSPASPTSTTSVAATTPPPTAPSSTTPASTTPPSTVPCPDSPVFDTGVSLRRQFVDHLVGCGFTATEAGCLFDELDFTDPAVAGGDTAAMQPAFEACGIEVERVLEIGGGL